MWEQIDNLIRDTLRVISKTYLFNTLRMDLLLHFFLGVILTLLIRRWKKSPLFGLSLVFLIQLIKEYYDSFTMTASLEEGIVDTLVTISYPLTLVGIHYFLKWSKRD